MTPPPPFGLPIRAPVHTVVAVCGAESGSNRNTLMLKSFIMGATENHVCVGVLSGGGLLLCEEEEEEERQGIPGSAHKYRVAAAAAAASSFGGGEGG